MSLNAMVQSWPSEKDTSADGTQYCGVGTKAGSAFCWALMSPLSATLCRCGLGVHLDRRGAMVEQMDHSPDIERNPLAREAELDRLARVELTALLDLEDAERKQKLLRRMHREVMHGGRYRVGSQGGAQSRFARVCRQYRGEPAHREPGRCCCGQLATSPRGASCDYCRERNRHYRRRYRAKVRARGSISRTA